jgi:hypothetical protein
LLLLLPASAAADPRNSVSSQFPIYANGGLPDLTVDPKRFESQLEIVDRLFEAGDCEFLEGSVDATGYRRLLRFDTVVMNMGGSDLYLGDPTDPQNPYHDTFEFSPCHGHYHISGFADYRLLNTDRTVADLGHKQAFCFISSLKYANTGKPDYTCRNQGIADGYGDWYYKQLSGQWIDITGVPKGDYIVQVTINAAGTFDEGENRHPNVVETTIHVPDPRNKVTVDSAPLGYEQ